MNLADLRRDSGYTQNDLAEIAGMTPLGIYRYEQLLYARPSNNYIAALSEISGVPANDLRKGYASCRDERIAETVDLFSTLFTAPDYSLDNVLSHTRSTVIHPYVRFRQGVCLSLDLPESSIHWCVLTCFHPGQLHRFESSGKSIPAVQRKILKASKMPTSDIEMLNFMISNFVEYRKSGFNED